MDHNDPWQIYAENGLPIKGRSATRDEVINNTTLVMGASHVWIWRTTEIGIEILLQKRSTTKRTWPGYFDISAAGHIDADETPVDAAVREAKEEIDLVISPDDLYYIFSLRTRLDNQELDAVYTYELKKPVKFNYNDGEVDELVWKSIDEFEEMTQKPEFYNLVPQGQEYFALVLQALRQM